MKKLCSFSVVQFFSCAVIAQKELQGSGTSDQEQCFVIPNAIRDLILNIGNGFLSRSRVLGRDRNDKGCHPECNEGSVLIMLSPDRVRLRLSDYKIED